MTSRLLPPVEWAKLDGTEAGPAWRWLPASARVFVVEDDEVIVGCWVLVPILHAECLYIAPAHRRKVSVGRRLLAGMRRLVTSEGAASVVTSALSAEVREMIQHIGGEELPGRHYVVPMLR